MASNTLQHMPAFEPGQDPTNTSARWTQWLERFNTYLAAADIKDETRQRALLLYTAGLEVEEVFKTLEDTGKVKDFKNAVDASTKYFEPQKKIRYIRHVYLDKQPKLQRKQSTSSILDSAG